MSNLLLALGQRLYLGEMENKDFCPPILGCFKAWSALIPFKRYFIAIYKVILTSMAIGKDQHYFEVSEV